MSQTAYQVNVHSGSIWQGGVAQQLDSRRDPSGRRFYVVVNQGAEPLYVQSDGTAATTASTLVRQGSATILVKVNAENVSLLAEDTGHPYVVWEIESEDVHPLTRTIDNDLAEGEAFWLLSCICPAGAITQFPDLSLVNVYMSGWASLGLAAAHISSGIQAFADGLKGHLLWYASVVDQYGIAFDYHVSGATMTNRGAQGTLSSPLASGTPTTQIPVGADFLGSDLANGDHIMVGWQDQAVVSGAQTIAAIHAAGHITVASFTPSQTWTTGEAISNLGDGTAVDSTDAPMAMFMAAAWAYYQSTGDIATITAIQPALAKMYRGITTRIIRPLGDNNQYMPTAKWPFYNAVFLLDCQEFYMGLRCGAHLWEVLGDKAKADVLRQAATDLAGRVDSQMYSTGFYGYAPSRSDIGVNATPDFTQLVTDLGQARNLMIIEGNGAKARAAAIEFHKQQTKPYVVNPVDQPLLTGYWDVCANFWSLQQWCGDHGRAVGEASARRYHADVINNFRQWPFSAMSAGQMLLVLCDTDPAWLGLD